MPQHLLIEYLEYACTLERLSLSVLQQAATDDSNPTASDIYRAHAQQTRGHLRLLEGRLRELGVEDLPDTEPVAFAGVRVEFVAGADRAPAELALGVHAVENLEIGLYQVLVAVALHARDRETELLARRVLEQEEDAAEVVASCLAKAAVRSPVG